MAVAVDGGRANLRSGSAPRWAFHPLRSRSISGSADPVSLVAPASDRYTLRVDCVNNLHSTPAPFENQWQPGRGVLSPCYLQPPVLEDNLREKFVALDLAIREARHRQNAFLEELNLSLLP